MIIRIRYSIKCIFFLLSDALWKKKTTSGDVKKLLIIHSDAIGDYVLFRNYISAIKQSDKFRDYEITLCGNIAYKDLAEHFDKSVVSSFIWLERSKFRNDLHYRKTFLQKIGETYYDVIINPSYSRDFIFGDSIVRAANGNMKIGQRSDLANISAIFRYFSNQWYTHLIDTGGNTIFEFTRNRLFCEAVTDQSPAFQKPYIDIPAPDVVTPYILLFPGAGEVIKQWRVEHFAACANFIKESFGLNSIVTGSVKEKRLGEGIQKLALKASVKNECGTLTLVELVQLIKNASLLISNDSSAIHIAACTNTPTICVGNGRQFNRFTPYPKKMAPHMHFIFPERINQMAAKDPAKLERLTAKHPIASINEITPEIVIDICKKLLTP